MKKTLHFSNFIQNLKKGLFLILFVFLNILASAQTITPTKTVTVRPGVCGKIDVELKIQGSNPVNRPLEVVLVIDVSGSMDDDIPNDPNIPLDYAQDAAVDFINKIFLAANNPTGKNKVSIVKYSSTATIVKPLTLSTGQADLINAINALTANGSTNIQDGIKKADNELTTHGTFDCVTSRSIVLLTDGVANRTGNDQNCSDGQQGSCIQSAITAANDAKTTTVSSVVYNNQIFSVGLFGAISGTDQTNAEYTLNNIQSGGSFFTENAANLTGIYNQIFTQLSWIAQQITGTPFDKETVSSDFTIGTITPSKGTASVSGQVISWNIDFLNVETITLKYELTPKANVCGTKTVSTSRLDYKNSACATAFLDITTPSTNVPCPTVTLASQTNVNCFGDSTGAITINNATGGSSPYTYAWKKNGSAFATTQNLTGLGAGTYTVIATDANGCASGELSIIITQPTSGLSIEVTSQTDVNCYNDLTGAIDLTVSGGTTAYSYTWKKDGNAIAATTQDLTGIGAGVYEVTVTDAKGCKLSKSITIIQPTSGLSIVVTSQTDVNCYNDLTGAIDLTVSGGTTAYSYTWKKDGNAIATTTQDLTGIGAGVYEVTVTDAKGCKLSKSITIIQPTSGLSIVVTSQTDVNCYNDLTGAIDLTVSGGTTAYSYTWKKDGNAIAATTQDLTGIGAGVYEVTVTDAKGCKLSKSITITQPTSGLSIVVTSQTDINCYNDLTGAIDLTVSGGTTAYSYTWKKDGNAIAATTQDLTGIGAGVYEVTVTDAKGCKLSKSITITQPTSGLSIVVTSQTDVNCYNDLTGAIDLTVSGGTSAYSYTWKKDGNAIAATTQDLTGIGAGVYEVIVTDAKGCKLSKSITITQPTSGLSIVVTSQTDINCYNDLTGAIDLTVSGGTTAYSYTWKKDGNAIAATTQDLTGIGAGVYEVTVTDAKGCKLSKSITITQPTSGLSIVVTSQTDVNCYNDLTGAIDLTVSGGTTAYSYTWKKDGNAIAATTQDLTGIGAGVYEVTVTDAKGCKLSKSITITQPTSGLSIVVTSQTDVNCYNDLTGAIDLTVSGGTSAYSYTWKKDGNAIAATTQDLTGIGAGVYEVIVTDAKGCKLSKSITITQPTSGLSIVVTSQTDVNCYNDLTGAIDLTVSGGTSAYSYTWKKDGNAIAATTQDLTGIGAGVYEVTVTDAKGCKLSKSITITQPTSGLSIVVTSQTDVNCYNDLTGAIDLTVSGGTSAYSYTWKKDGNAIAATTQDLTGIGAGVYEVTVTDAKGCKLSKSITIIQPQAALTCSISQDKAVSSNGLSDGQATVTPLGGNGGYTYLWDNGETTQKAIALSAGSHSVTVTDSKGCRTSCEITISQPDVLSCSITQDAPAKCYGDSNGKATVTAIGGNGEYTYLWDNGETTAQAVGLNAGNHSVTVTDKLGYKTTCNVTIGQPQAALTCSITQNKAVSANGLSDGQATVTPLGGNGGNTYLWDNGETTAKAVALNAGLHTVTVTDSKGCKTTCEITISQPDVLSCSITQDAPAKCYGDSNGKATVTAIGGNGEYTYLWDNGETTAQAVGLNAGNHSVTVTDKLGYKTTCNVTIGQPQAALTCSITQNKAVSANGLSDGQATVTPLGGNGGNTYLWDNGETTAKAVALNAGLHTVTVTDSKGCKTTCEITISQPDVLSCSITQDAPAKCYGDSNGKATVTAIGGNGEYTYLWDNGETTAQAVGLNAGNHSVTVTDKLGYKTTCNVTIGQPQAALTCSITQNKAVSANGLSDGQATVTPLGGNGGNTYLWDNGETTAKAVALNAGLHTVTVTDSKGCKTTCEITISQPDVLSCSITQDAPAKCYGDSNGKATVTAIGGNGEYTYLWDNGETTAQAVGLNAGNHSVTVTDKLGYKTTCNVTIGQPQAALTCSITQNKAVSANGLSDGQATVTPLGGNGGNTYLWDNGETTAKAVALNAGLHTVTVTDSKGCKTTCEITISQPDVLSCSITQDAPAKCYGDSNGKATVTAIGGNGEYTYLWDNGETTAQAVGLNAGNHSVTVTDKLGYKTTCNVTIGQPSAPLSATAVIVNNNNCVGCSNGSIDITVAGGTTPYTFIWSNGAATEDISNLPNGTYTVEITDKNGCKANYTYVISESSINITKDGTYVDSNQDGITNVGDVVAYKFVVTNTGSLTLTNIIVTDNNAVITGGPIVTLAPGATDSTTFSGSHIITQDDINTGYVYNLATVTGKDPEDKPVTDTSSDPTPCTTCPIDPECPDCTITPLEQTPGINITKDGTYVDSNQDGITNVGDVVTYNFVIKNTGNTTLTNITVTDNNATITGGPIATLAVGATDSTTFSGSHVITQDDINTGYVYNLATATGIDPKGNPVTDTSSDPTPCTTCPIDPECPDCTITPLEQTPGINITKDGTYVDSNQDGITNVGDVVTYNFVIKNTGNTTLTNITVTDNNATITGGPIATLAVGATDSTTFSGSHVITQDDINTGYVYNLATATGKDPKGNPVTDTSSDPTPCTTCPINPECPDCTITPLTQTPGLVVIKTATTASYSVVGDIINYTITVKNTGNTTLHQITVKDPLTGLDTIIEALAPGASAEYTQSYTVTQEDLNKGSVTNIATADGFTPNETPISASDDEIVNEKPNTIDAVDDNAGTIVGVNQITPNVINVFTNDTLNASPVNPADVILTTVTSNPFLQMNPDGSIDVLPDAPVGTQTMTYQICEKLNTTNCDSAMVTVIIEGPSMTVSGEGTCTNDVPYFNYITTANNFTPVNGLTLTWTDSNNNVVATMTNLPLNGKVLWPGAVVDANGNGVDWPGWILVEGKWIEGADGFENLRPTASVTFTLNPSETIIANYPPSTPYCTARPVFTIDAVDDVAGPIDGINGATNILNVLKNDTLNTVAVNPADVTLTLVTADPTGYMTMNTDGSIDIKDGTPAGTYVLTYQICENADEGNCDTATVTITVICTDKTKISGIVFNAGTNTPLANVPVNLVPQGTTTGPIQIKITNAQGYYNFTGMVPGEYLVQVQDANLNAAYQLYPTNSSLFFTTLENCKYQTHDFGYDKSDLPVLGDFVWYDVNNNGLQDEWFDANNDGLVTKNIPDANGAFDYSKWEWIDLNGDGSYKGQLNVGELNAAGFGNAKSPNLFVTGPNDYNKSVIIGIQGFWRNRPPVGAFGDYKVELKMDANLEAQSSALGATGLVKVLPNTGKNEVTKNTSKPVSFEVCGPTNGNPQTASLTATNQVNLDIDFGISCKMFANIQATNDTYNVTQCSIVNDIRNALSNDLLNGSPASISAFKFKLLTALGQYIKIDDTGNITFVNGVAAGQYTFDYQVCEAANPTNCSTATITINVAGIEPVTISGTTCNADTTPVDLNSLLPQGVPAGGTWIDTENTGGLNGNILNAFGIPINKYKYEYKLAGDCPRSIFLILDVNDDCKVLPCKTIIVHNAFSSNEDGRNDYFQIENIEDNLCYKNIRVEVFNRWGVLVFEKDNYDNEGNAFRGRSEGRTTISKNEGLPTGTYFYVISYDTVDGLGKTLRIKKDGYLYLVK